MELMEVNPKREEEFEKLLNGHSVVIFKGKADREDFEDFYDDFESTVEDIPYPIRVYCDWEEHDLYAYIGFTTKEEKDDIIDVLKNDVSFSDYSLCTGKIVTEYQIICAKSNRFNSMMIIHSDRDDDVHITAEVKNRKKIASYSDFNDAMSAFNSAVSSEEVSRLYNVVYLKKNIYIAEMFENKNDPTFCFIRPNLNEIDSCIINVSISSVSA